MRFEEEKFSAFEITPLENYANEWWWWGGGL